MFFISAMLQRRFYNLGCTQTLLPKKDIVLGSESPTLYPTMGSKDYVF